MFVRTYLYTGDNYTVIPLTQMAIRKKNRNSFQHSGRSFVWWIDNDTYLRIASENKTFVVAYLIFDTPEDVGGILVVHGSEFAGLEGDSKRPAFLETPRSIADMLQNSIGATVDAVLTWSLDPKHDIIRYNRNEPSFLQNTSDSNNAG